MKEYLLICLFYVFVACGNKQKNENLIYNKNDSLNITQVKDSLIFSKEDKIIEISHYQNNVKDGFSLILNKTTHLPKYLVEYNEGKRDEIIIEFLPAIVSHRLWHALVDEPRELHSAL